MNETKAQVPKVNSVKCKDCNYRNRSTFKYKGKEKPIGVVKMFCEKYTEKPKEVLFDNADCEYYEKE